jgi:aromatic ring-opening dioxygenase LigB subunit
MINEIIDSQQEKIKALEERLERAKKEIGRLNNVICSPQGYEFYDDVTEQWLRQNEKVNG